MKNLRRIASILLAMAMVFSMSFTAIADDTSGDPAVPAEPATGSITVENPKAGQTYTAYKIFDAVRETNGDKFSYSLSETSAWFSVIAAKHADGTVSSKIPGLSFEPVTGTAGTYAVKTLDTFSAPDFANTLKAAVSPDKDGKNLIVSGGKATAAGLDLGYYFVTSASGALCNLTTTSPNATIYDKNDVPFEKTDDNTTSAEVGQEVRYTIKGKVPNTEGFTTYIYKITDTMSDGLTFNNNVTVKIDGEEISEKDRIITSTPKGFELAIDVMRYQDQVGAVIEVTYSATVNEAAIGKVEHNRATLTYSNNPADSTTTTTPPVEEPVYSAKIVIDKYDAGDTSIKLQGAKFLLYKMDGANKLYYKYTAAGTDNAKVEWVPENQTPTEAFTDSNGSAEFTGLKEGTYYLEETAAPAGYHPLSEPVRVSIEGETALTVTVPIPNGNGTLLPSAGGMGTTLFYILGGLLVAAAAGLIAAKRGKNNETH